MRNDNQDKVNSFLESAIAKVEEDVRKQLEKNKELIFKNPFLKMAALEGDIRKQLKENKELTETMFLELKNKSKDIIPILETNADEISKKQIRLWTLKANYYYNYIYYVYTKKPEYYQAVEKIKVQIGSGDLHISKDKIEFNDEVKDSNEGLEDWYRYRNNPEEVMKLPFNKIAAMLINADLRKENDRMRFFQHLQDEGFIKAIFSSVKIEELKENLKFEENNAFRILLKKILSGLRIEESLRELFANYPALKNLYSNDDSVKKIIELAQFHNIITETTLKQKRQIVEDFSSYEPLFNTDERKVALHNSNPYSYAKNCGLSIEDLILGKANATKKKSHITEFKLLFNSILKSELYQDEKLVKNLIKHANTEELDNLLREFSNIVSHKDMLTIELIVNKIKADVLKNLKNVKSLQKLHGLISSHIEILSYIALTDYSLSKILDSILKEGRKNNVGIFLLRLITRTFYRNKTKGHELIVIQLSNERNVRDVAAQYVYDMVVSKSVNLIDIKSVLEACILGVWGILVNDVLYAAIKIENLNMLCFKKIASDENTFKKIQELAAQDKTIEPHQLLNSNIYFAIYNFETAKNDYSEKIQILANKILDGSIYSNETFINALVKRYKGEKDRIDKFDTIITVILEADDEFRSCVIKKLNFQNYQLLHKFSVIDNAFLLDHVGISRIERLVSLPLPDLISEDYVAGYLYFYQKIIGLKIEKGKNKNLPDNNYILKKLNSLADKFSTLFNTICEKSDKEILSKPAIVDKLKNFVGYQAVTKEIQDNNQQNLPTNRKLDVEDKTPSIMEEQKTALKISESDINNNSPSNNDALLVSMLVRQSAIFQGEKKENNEKKSDQSSKTSNILSEKDEVPESPVPKSG